MQRVLAIAIVVSITSARAHAQSSDSSIAEQLFNEARELVKANRWAEACPKFEASLHSDPALGTRLNLATCYEHTGKLVAAWGLYRESIELATKTGDVKRRDYALTQVAALEPRLPKLAITVPSKPPAGFIVKRDGKRLDPGELGVALYVDPGAHEITASAPGFEAFTRTVMLAEGKADTLAIPDLTAAPESGVVPSPTRKRVALGLGAGGVVAVGVGLLFGQKARSTYSDAKTLCGERLACDPADYERGKQLIGDARSSAMISTVLVATGGAAIVAGSIVLLTIPRARERVTARIVPVVHDRGAGLAVAGRF
jgi:tetratricopeptide (TPR) repeat protein